MSNPKFNPAPRCILIQPTHDSSIVYYMAVMDIPNSMCHENPFGNALHKQINQADSSSKDLIIELPKGILFPANFQPNSPGDFKTFLMPIIAISSVNGNLSPKENIIVQDEQGNKKIGQIDASKTLALFKAPYSSPGNQPERTMAFKPFVIQNTSHSEHAFFIGGLLRYKKAEYPNWGTTIDPQKSILSPPRFILCPSESTAQSTNNSPFENIFVCFESERDGYESIELEGDTDPDDAGLFQYDAGVNLYDFPSGLI